MTVYDCMYRYVVELMGMVVEFIQNLEMKIKMVQAIPTTDSYLSNFVSVYVCTVCVFWLNNKNVLVKFIWICYALKLVSICDLPLF